MSDEFTAPKIFKSEDFNPMSIEGDLRPYIIAQKHFAQWYKDQGFQTGSVVIRDDQETPFFWRDHEEEFTHKILFRVEKLEEECNHPWHVLLGNKVLIAMNSLLPECPKCQEKLPEEKEPCDLDHKTVYEMARLTHFKEGDIVSVGMMFNVICPSCKKDVSQEEK